MKRLVLGLCALAAGCATGGMPRAKQAPVAFTGEPYEMRDSGDRIDGKVCGIDIEYTVQERPDGTLALSGFIDARRPAYIELRQRNGQREISGSLGEEPATGAVDLQLSADRLRGRVGLRNFELSARDDQLVGQVRVAGTERPSDATVLGRSVLQSMPAADQAALLPPLLSCFMARIGRAFTREPFVVRVGGPPGALPQNTAGITRGQ
jgi:hypothetical protein